MPARSQQAELASLGPDGRRALVEAFLTAWERADEGWFRLGAVNLLSLRDGRVAWIAGFLDRRCCAGFPCRRNFSAGPMNRAPVRSLIG